MQWDVFISHASEDKETFVRGLAEELKLRGLKVWYDEFTMEIGDSLSRSIDKGLANSRYGIVVLSKAFFKKKWPQKELAGLTARERSRGKVILPIWHGVTHDEVLRYSVTLADRVALVSSWGQLKVAEEILRIVAPRSSRVFPLAEDHGHLARIPISTASPKVFPDATETAWPMPRDLLPPSVGAFIVSPDNRHLAHIAARGEKVTAVVDGQYSDHDFDTFANHTLVFSPDSQKVAYAMSRGKKWWVILDGIMSDAYYDGIPQYGISFSPDSNRLVFQAQRGDSWVVVVDGIEGKPYQLTSVPFFSPDSRKVAYFGYNADLCFLVVNGREVDKVNPTSEERYRFTNDSSRVELVKDTLDGGFTALSIPDMELGDYRLTGTDLVPIVPDSVVQSPDNKRKAFIVQYGNGFSVVAGGNRGLVHEAVLATPPVFSPDSMHLAYAAEDYLVWRLVVDGVVGETSYDRIILGSKPHFLNSKTLNILAGRGDSIYYVETEIR